MNVNGMIAYTEGEFLGVKNLRRYDGLDGAIYFIGSNANLDRLYSVFENRDYLPYIASSIGLQPRYNVHPLMNMNRNYALEIRDGKFAIVTAEKIVENLLKW